MEIEVLESKIWNHIFQLDREYLEKIVIYINHLGQKLYEDYISRRAANLRCDFNSILPEQQTMIDYCQRLHSHILNQLKVEENDLVSYLIKSKADPRGIK